MTDTVVDVERLTGEIERLLAARGLELWHLEWKESGRRGKLKLTIDKEGGVSLSDCETVSHLVGSWLDVEDPFPGKYDLEVESPGLDRLLHRPTDYQRFLGRRVKSALIRPIDGRRMVAGTLRACDGTTVEIVDDRTGHPYNVRLPDIRWTRLEIDL